MQKVLVITGASRGIGAATARKSAQQGYAVCINYLTNQQATNAIVEEIIAIGGKAIAVMADMSQEAQIENLFHEVDKRLGPLTALVNNVGILEHKMRIEEMDMARLNRIFTTNIAGYFLCAREAIKRLSTRHGGKGGAIVNVSSAASRLGAANEYVDYALQKARLIR